MEGDASYCSPEMVNPKYKKVFTLTTSEFVGPVRRFLVFCILFFR